MPVSKTLTAKIVLAAKIIMKTSNKKLHTNIEQAIVDDLIGVLSFIDHPIKMRKFLENFFSSNELLGFAKRLAIIKALKSGESYEKIQEKYQVSSATVSSAGELKNLEF